jgi:hypothetical protein
MDRDGRIKRLPKIFTFWTAFSKNLGKNIEKSLNFKTSFCRGLVTSDAL